MIRTVVSCLLACCLAAPSDAVDSGLPESVLPDCIGVNIHLRGPQDEQARMIADAGFRFIRMDFSWSLIEKEKGVYDFSLYDPLLDSLEKHGIRAMLILDYGNRLYDEARLPYSEEGRKAFASFAAAGAARYKGRGVLWELWNEPDGAESYELYARLAKVVYPEIKKADPNALLLAPAVAATNTGWLEGAFKNGLLEATDVISLHGYGVGRPEDVTFYCDRVRSLARKYGPAEKNIPIVMGEWGFTSYARIPVEEKARWVPRMLLTNLMNGMRLSIHYDWHNDGTDPNNAEHNYGLLSNDLKPGPAYEAWRTLAREFEGFTFAAAIGDTTGQSCYLLFRKGDQYKLAAWTGEPGVTVTDPIPLDVDKVEVVSLSGEKQTAAVKNGQLRVPVTNDVRYITPIGHSKRWAAEEKWNVSVAAVPDRDGLVLDVKSTGLKTSSLRVAGVGVHKMKPPPGKSAGSQHTRYRWDGNPRAKVKISAAVPGLDRDLERLVLLDLKRVPVLKVAPPTEREMLIQVSAPEGFAFRGKVWIDSAKGFKLASPWRAVDLKPGESVLLRFPLRGAPENDFSIACSLMNEHGARVVQTPIKRYSLVESWEGKPGEEVTGYSVGLDGKTTPPAEAKIVYSVPPPRSPVNSCIRMDYSFGAGGARFVRAICRPMRPIEGRPTKAVAWAKGSGRADRLLLRIVDDASETFQPLLGHLYSSDWKLYEADLTSGRSSYWYGNGVVDYPIKWDTVFLLVGTNTGGTQTTYIGPMLLCYD